MRAVTQPVDVLGESPVWSRQENALYWVDIRAPSLCRLDQPSGAVTRCLMPDLIGAVMLREGGGLVLGMRTGLYGLDSWTGTPELLVAIEEGHAGNRINDSRCDRAGRLWFTTMWDFGKCRTGSLYRMGADFEPRRLVTDLRIPNAIAFSPDGDLTYFADSAIGSISLIATDPSTGASLAPREWVPAGAVAGKPDGATVDAEGFVWNARFGAGLLARFTPDGSLDRLVSLPVSNPTSCSFGGEHLETIFITTATQGLDKSERHSQPLAGAVLAFEPGVRGLPEPAFRGDRSGPPIGGAAS